MTEIKSNNLSDTETADLTVEFGDRPSMPALDGITDQHRRAGLHLSYSPDAFARHEPDGYFSGTPKARQDYGSRICR